MKKILLAIFLVLSLPSVTHSAELGKCQQKMFDTHLHFQEGAELIFTRMAERNVGCAVLLNIQIDPDSPKADWNEFAEEISPYTGRYLPFVDLDPGEKMKKPFLNTLLELSDEKLTGLGENAFYSAPFDEMALTDEAWHRVFKYAGTHDLVLMLHLRGPEQETELRTMLGTYPNTKVLIHGFELIDALPELLPEFDNLYFTVDTSLLLYRFPTETEGSRNLLYPEGDGNATEFNTILDDEFDELVEYALEQWAPVIAAAPNRVMWGTDVSERWHLRKGVYRRLLKFSRAFIRGLPEDLQDKYKYKNAVRLFGKNGTSL